METPGTRGSRTGYVFKSGQECEKGNKIVCRASEPVRVSFSSYSKLRVKSFSVSHTNGN